MNNYKFTNIEDLKTEIVSSKNRYIQLYSKVMDNYSGMIERYELDSLNYGNKLSLTHIFECRGLDWFGDTLYKEIQYTFETVESLIAYLKNKYNISFEDFSEGFPANMPNQADATNEETKLFKEHWKRFEKDFDNRIFIDKELQLLNIVE